MKKWIMIVCICMLFGCEETSNSVIQTAGTTDQIPVEVVGILDGDTIKVKYNGNIEKVRYLLIDTPETNHKTLGKQPFGEEAKYRNIELLNSGNVTMEFDVGKRLDNYGRMLAYLYVDGVSVQETLLAEVLARVAYVFPPNTRYIDEFEKAAATAKKEKIGIWESENYVTNRGFDSAVINSNNISFESNGKCLIKGNINLQGKKIFHIPSGKHYEETNPEQWFCTEAEAIKAGFKKSGE